MCASAPRVTPIGLPGMDDPAMQSWLTRWEEFSAVRAGTQTPEPAAKVTRNKSAVREMFRTPARNRKARAKVKEAGNVTE